MNVLLGLFNLSWLELSHHILESILINLGRFFTCEISDSYANQRFVDLVWVHKHFPYLFLALGCLRILSQLCSINDRSYCCYEMFLKVMEWRSFLVRLSVFNWLIPGFLDFLGRSFRQKFDNCFLGTILASIQVQVIDI